MMFYDTSAILLFYLLHILQLLSWSFTLHSSAVLAKELLADIAILHFMQLSSSCVCSHYFATRFAHLLVSLSKLP